MLVDNEKIMDRTEAINKIPAQPGLIGSFGWFQDRNVNSDTVTFSVKANQLKVLTDKLRSTADTGTVEEGGFDQHTIHIPHFPVESTISREMLAGVRAFDSEQERSMAQAVAQHLEDHRESIDLHHEYQKAKMLINAQLVTTKHGTYDMESEFNVTRPTHNMDFTGAGDVLNHFRQLQNKAKAGLINGQARGYVLLAGDDLYEWLLYNDDLFSPPQRDVFGMTSPIVQVLGDVGAAYSSFTVGSTMVVNYNDSFTLPDGSTDTPLAAAEGVFAPRARVGKTFYGPENTLDGLSRGGQQAFSRTIMDPRNRFITCASETNSLPILESVEASIKVTYTP